MQQKYVVTHGPSGRSVTVLAYTPEEAQTKALVQLQKVVGLATSVTGKPATTPQPAAHVNNTSVALASNPTVKVPTKLMTPTPKK